MIGPFEKKLLQSLSGRQSQQKVLPSISALKQENLIISKPEQRYSPVQNFNMDTFFFSLFKATHISVYQKGQK